LLVRLSKSEGSCPIVCQCVIPLGFVKCADELLIEIPSSLPDNTTELFLPGNRITKINFQMLQNTGIDNKLQTLNLMDNKIKFINPGSFKNMQMLKQLYLLNNSLTVLKTNTFVGLLNLEELNLSRNKISILEIAAFNGLSRLKTLELWGNKLYSIGSFALHQMESLAVLSLGDNLFEKVPTSALKPLVNLLELKMLNLPVIKLEKNSFSTLKKLKKLHISDWLSLEQLSEDAFNGLESLSYLSLQSCKLDHVPQQAFAKLKNLEELNLSNNPINLEKSTFESTPQLKELYLSNIGVHIIHENPFVSLKKLVKLDLSQNNIEVLVNHLFLQLRNLEDLNLSENSLTTLSSRMIEPLRRLSSIDLSGNKMICDCDLKWLKRHFDEKFRSAGKPFTLLGKCQNPNKYKNIDIRSIPIKDFECRKPEFWEEPSQIVAKLGMPLNVTCSPDRVNPEPEITWQIDFKSVQNKNKYVFSDGILHMSKVELSDFREYVCVATNKIGFAKHSVFVQKHYDPDWNRKDKKPTNKNTSKAAIIIAILIFIVIFFLLCIKKNFILLLYKKITNTTSSSYSSF